MPRRTTNEDGKFTTIRLLYCAAIFTPASRQLATNGGALVTSSFIPTSSQWRAETVKIGLCGIASDITIGFKSINSYGNNIYLDKIIFDKYTLPDPNVEISAVIDPNGLYCSGSIQPKVRIFNKGTNTLTSVTFNYNIDGGPY